MIEYPCTVPNTSSGTVQLKNRTVGGNCMPDARKPLFWRAGIRIERLPGEG
jgi:hypothetical protein